MVTGVKAKPKGKSKPEVVEEQLIVAEMPMRMMRLRLVGITPLYLESFHRPYKYGKQIMEEVKESFAKACHDRDIEKVKEVEASIDRDYESGFLQFEDGVYGLPSNAIRLALLSACPLASFKKVSVRLGVSNAADGQTKDGVPLLRIHGTPQRCLGEAVNKKGQKSLVALIKFSRWHIDVDLSFSRNMFKLTDLRSLIEVCGLRVGFGAGRADGKELGMATGQFHPEIR